MKKVSVIVPAYNAHDTLARSLTSLVHQTLEDIEIIVINDASKDDTWEIMQRCQNQFPDKVTIINNPKNLGCGGTQNVGLNAASGEYIGFCDSDDYVSTDMYEKLYTKAKETNADIVDCGFYAEAVDSATIKTPDDAVGILDDAKRRLLILQGGYLCTKIIRRELFSNPPIRIREDVRALSDNDILKYLYLKAESIWTVKEVLYHYSDAPGSSTKTIDLESYYDSIYGVMEATYRLCHELPTYDGNRETIEYAQLVWYSYGINRCLYDQISRLGAGESNISAYFDGVSEKENKLLAKLAELKEKIISIPIRNNPEVVSRISELDIKIMEECDRRFGSENAYVENDNAEDENAAYLREMQKFESNIMGRYVTITVEGLSYVNVATDRVIMLQMYQAGENFAKDSMEDFYRLANTHFTSGAQQDIFLEIGANIGTTCIYFKKKLDPSIKILAFEPAKENYKLLKTNLLLNEIGEEDVQVVKCALSDRKSIADFSYNEENPGGSSLISQDDADTESVQTISLDEYVDENGVDVSRIKYIWIDIEGFEPPFFKGAEKTLAKINVPIITEFTPDLYKKTGEFGELAGVLSRLYKGFIIMQEGNDRIHSINELWNYENFEYTIDIMLLK